MTDTELYDRLMRERPLIDLLEGVLPYLEACQIKGHEEQLAKLIEQVNGRINCHWAKHLELERIWSGETR